MGKAVLDLQHNLPLARVVYASATGGPFSHCTWTSVFSFTIAPSYNTCTLELFVFLFQSLFPFLNLIQTVFVFPLPLSPCLFATLSHLLSLSLSLYQHLTLLLCLPPGASEPKNMIYMSRLGIWGEGTPFKTFDDFLHAIEKRSDLIPHIIYLIYVTVLPVSYYSNVYDYLCCENDIS